MKARWLAVAVLILWAGVADAQSTDKLPEIIYPTDQPSQPAEPAPAPAPKPQPVQCQVWIRTRLGSREVICPLAESPPIGSNCACGLGQPLPGELPSGPVPGKVIP
jgi:hypothetical protein